MAYTKVPKPTGTNYIKIGPQGAEFFDDAGVTFDDPATVFDGVNQFAWTDIPKPTGNSTFFVGIATGLMIPLTRKGSQTSTDDWVRINKPI